MDQEVINIFDFADFSKNMVLTAKAELLDLLEGVISYNGAKEIARADLVMFYRHLLYLVRLVYKMDERMICEIA